MVFVKSVQDCIDHQGLCRAEHVGDPTTVEMGAECAGYNRWRTRTEMAGLGPALPTGVGRVGDHNHIAGISMCVV